MIPGSRKFCRSMHNTGPYRVEHSFQLFGYCMYMLHTTLISIIDTLHMNRHKTQHSQDQKMKTISKGTVPISSITFHVSLADVQRNTSWAVINESVGRARTFNPVPWCIPWRPWAVRSTTTLSTRSTAALCVRTCPDCEG